MEIKKIKGGKVYIDTNIFIYFLEKNKYFGEKSFEIIQHCYENNIVMVTSELTLAECLVFPMKTKNINSLNNYRNYLKNNKKLAVVPISRNILLQSAHIRAKYPSNKLPDAIHIATALQNNCKYFIGNDKRLKIPKELKGLNIKDLVK